jgi:hypothetical protein
MHGTKEFHGQPLSTSQAADRTGYADTTLHIPASVLFIVKAPPVYYCGLLGLRTFHFR